MYAIRSYYASELINKADKIILVGGGFESFLETSVDKIAPAKKILTTDIAGRKVILSTPHHHDEEEGNKEQHNEDIKTPDPHLWLDFSLWKNTMLRTSYEAAKDLHIDIPKNSVTSFLGKMDELENLGLNNLSSLRGKSLISTHLAYKYWERKYGLKNYGIKGTNDTSQASLKSLTELETLIKQKKIKAIFVEPNDANKEVKALKASLSKADVEINVIPIYLGTIDNSRNNFV